MDSYDKDKDGLLDYPEFLCYMMDRERKWKIHFHDLDKNKCGESFWDKRVFSLSYSYPDCCRHDPITHVWHICLSYSS